MGLTNHPVGLILWQAGGVGRPLENKKEERSELIYTRNDDGWVFPTRIRQLVSVALSNEDLRSGAITHVGVPNLSPLEDNERLYTKLLQIEKEIDDYEKTLTVTVLLEDHTYGLDQRLSGGSDLSGGDASGPGHAPGIACSYELQGEPYSDPYDPEVHRIYAQPCEFGPYGTGYPRPTCRDWFYKRPPDGSARLVL